MFPCLPSLDLTAQSLSVSPGLERGQEADPAGWLVANMLTTHHALPPAPPSVVHKRGCSVTCLAFRQPILARPGDRGGGAH